MDDCLHGACCGRVVQLQQQGMAAAAAAAGKILDLIAGISASDQHEEAHNLLLVRVPTGAIITQKAPACGSATQQGDASQVRSG